MKKTGIELIAEERKRQIEVEGYTLENDKKYNNNELSNAAICYAMTHEERDYENEEGVSLNVAIWPFELKYWKPSPENRIRELQKAGALIAAQIDYLISNCKHENVICSDGLSECTDCGVRSY